MLSERCILTAVCGNAEILSQTAPAMAKYALSCDADYRIVNRTAEQIRYKTPQHVKRHIDDELERYNRICWLDYDCLVTPNAPSIFEEVPEEYLGAWFRENELFQNRPKYRHGYFNSGVLVLSRSHRGLITRAISNADNEKYPWTREEASVLFHEQTALNRIVDEEDVPVYSLSEKWNCIRSSCLKDAYEPVA